MTGTITNEHLVDIERAFDASVLSEILTQYAQNGERPSEKVAGALGRIYGKTADELEAVFETRGIVRKQGG